MLTIGGIQAIVFTGELGHYLYLSGLTDIRLKRRARKLGFSIMTDESSHVSATG